MRGQLRVALTVAVAIALGFVAVRMSAQGGNARAAIEAANKKFMQAGAKGDVATIGSLYGADAQAYPPNSDVARGRAAIEKLWKSVFDSGIAGFDLATTEVESQGNLAYESGTYAMKTKDGKVADRGKYVVVWKRVNGQWLIHRDIWNTSQPEAKK